MLFLYCKPLGICFGSVQTTGPPKRPIGSAHGGREGGLHFGARKKEEAEESCNTIATKRLEGHEVCFDEEHDAFIKNPDSFQGFPVHDGGQGSPIGHGQKEHVRAGCFESTQVQQSGRPVAGQPARCITTSAMDRKEVHVDLG